MPYFIYISAHLCVFCVSGLDGSRTPLKSAILPIFIGLLFFMVQFRCNKIEKENQYIDSLFLYVMRRKNCIFNYKVYFFSCTIKLRS